MKIYFAKLPSERKHPLEGEDFGPLKAVVGTALVSRIRTLSFKDNQRTTQEARLRYYGTQVDIAINFCCDGGTSRMLSADRRYVSIVERLGGVVHPHEKRVHWTPKAAKVYAYFLILHELAHVVYLDEHPDISDFRGSREEERWCDAFALKHALQLMEDPRIS